MKTLFIAAALLAASVNASAQVGAGAIAGSASESTAVAGSAARSDQTQAQQQGQAQQMGQGQVQGVQVTNAPNVAPAQSMTYNEASQPANVTQRVEYSGSQTVKSAPGVAIGAGTVINNDLCVVQTSFGGSGIGFGVGFTGGLTDDDCVRRINARQLFNMGYAKAAIALMAKNKDVAEALKSAGLSPVGEPLPTTLPAPISATEIQPRAAAGAVSKPGDSSVVIQNGVRMRRDNAGNWGRAE